MRFALILALSPLILSSPLSSQGRSTELETTSVEQPVDGLTQTEDVAFSNDGFERMTVPVRLAGNGPFRFLVDTGADRTAISRELASQLKLEAGGRASVHSVSGVESVETAKMPALQLTGRDVHLANAPLLNRMDMGADGILGTDSLRSQRVHFNFKTGTMSIVPAVRQEAREEDGTIVIRAHERNGRLILSRATADGTSIAVVIDTGAQLTVGNEALRRRLMRSGKGIVERMGKIELSSVTGGKLTGDYVMINELTLGGVKLSNLAVVFAEAHTFKRLGFNKKPAVLLGMNAMRAFDKVSIDFANRKLRLMMPETSDAGGVQFASTVFTGQH